MNNTHTWQSKRRHPQASVLFGLAAMCFLSGCASVPGTRISGKVSGHTFVIESPKQFFATNITVTAGGITFHADVIASANEAEIVKAVAESQERIMRSFATGLGWGFARGLKGWLP